MQAYAKLAQLDKHQTVMADVPISFLTGGNILLLIFLFSRSKPLMPFAAYFVYFVKT